MNASAGSDRESAAPMQANLFQTLGGSHPVREQKASARGQATIIQAAGSVIAGDVFVGRFARLRDKWLDPAPVFQEVEVEHFTGREWLLDQVDRFLAAHDHGYVIVQADAGLGKTAFAAYLTRANEWPSHFTRRRKGRAASTALGNLAVQLIAKYQLDDQFAPHGILPETAGEPGWFDQVLRAAADRARANGQQVVIVVDGLDEAETVEGDPPLGLPAVLPRGAFIVATCRTGTNLPALRQPWKKISFAPEDRRNTSDLERFLHATLTGDQELAALLSAAGTTAGAVAERLLDRCGGVWVYLRYVLEELRLGQRSVEDIDGLPADLAGFYAESLMAGHDDPGWGRLMLPLLAVLAVAAEPLPVATLTRLAGLPDPHLVHVLCGNRLRPFLTATTGEAGEQRYSVYHASLREFLAGRGPATLADGVQAQREELARASSDAHARIASHYLAAFGGLSEGLPVLAASPAIAGQDDGYALRRLAEHLDRAGRPDDLDALLACERRAPARGSVWFAAHEQAGNLGDYRDDIDRARRRAASRTDRSVELGRPAPGFVLELRYAMIDAAIRTLTANIPPALITRLVESGLWSRPRGLFYARQPSDPGNRAAALAALVPHLPEGERPAVTREAIATTEQMSQAYERAWAFTALLEQLPEPRPDQVTIAALAATAQVTGDDDKADFLTRMIDYLPDSFLPEAASIGIALKEDALRAEVLRALVPRLPDAVLAAVLAAAQDITDSFYRSEVIAALAGRVPADMIADLTAAVRTIPASDDRAWVLGIIAHRTPESRERLVREALVSARSTENPANRAWALASLAGRLPEDERSELLDEALAAARAADDHKVWAMGVVARELPSGSRRRLLAEALRTALAIPAGSEQTDSLATLAGNLSRRLVPKAAAAILTVKLEPDRARLLTAYAPFLPEEWLEPTFKAAVEMREETQRGSALAGLAPYLPDRLVTSALSAAAGFSDPPRKRQLIARLAARLPDRLLPQALSSVQSMTNEGGSARFLCALAVRMSGPQSTQLLREALDVARSGTDALMRAQALSDIAVLLTEAERSQVLDEAIQAAKSSPYEYARVYALDHLIPLLAPPQRERATADALAITRAMTDAGLRAWLLAELACHVPRSQRAALHAEALEAAHNVTSEQEKLEVLSAVAVCFPDDQRISVVCELRTLVKSVTGDAPAIVRLAAKTASRLPEQLVVRALELTRQAMYEDSQVTGRERVLRHIPGALISEALDALPEHIGGLRCAHALGTGALYMPAAVRQKSLDLALGAAETVVARRAILTQACLLWQQGITTADLDIFRRTITGIGLDECLHVLASAPDIVTQIAGARALDDCLEAFRTVQQWWPPPEAGINSGDDRTTPEYQGTNHGT